MDTRRRRKNEFMDFDYYIIFPYLWKASVRSEVLQTNCVQTTANFCMQEQIIFSDSVPPHACYILPNPLSSKSTQ